MRNLFEDYLFMRAEIDRLLSEDTTASDVVRGSSPESPYTAHTIRVRGIDTQYANWIAERVETLRAQCAEVEAATALAPNSMIRLILIYRYHEGITDWDEVGARLPIPKTGEACRKLAHRYIDGLKA